MDEATYQKLKKRVEVARQTRDRATGALEGVLARLKAEFGCDTIEQAEKLAAKLERDAVTAEHVFEEEAAKFEKEYSEHANG